MIDVRSRVRGSRFRSGWRLSALIAWATTVAVLFAQGIVPSYAGISVSTIGSSDTVHMNIVEWHAGVPSKVAAYLPDRSEPIVTDIDPAVIRSARLVETGISGGWTHGTVIMSGGTLPPAIDVSYRQTASGLDAVTSDPADPFRTISIHVPPPSAQDPQVLPLGPIVFALLAAVAACAVLEYARDQSCATAAKKTCGDQGVKCTTTPGTCGIGSCRIHCNGDQGSCD